jgi:hypothetical protein
MKNRAFHAVAMTVSLLLMVAVPAQASPIQIGDVIQVVTASQRNGGQNASIELRFLAQDDRASAGTVATTSGSSASGTASSSGLVASLQDPTDGSIVQVDVTEDIGVEECECGDFTVPVAGFPVWPFALPLAGLVCLVPDLCTNCTPEPGEDEDCNPTRIPDCVELGTCPQVPEPASLILFGSGIAALGAGIRRRRAQAKIDQATTISGS